MLGSLPVFATYRGSAEGEALSGREDQLYEYSGDSFEASFLQLAYTLHVFWASILLAPIACYTLWAAVPYLAGALPFADGAALLFAPLHDLGASLLELLTLRIGWPDWLGVELLYEALTDLPGLCLRLLGHIEIFALVHGLLDIDVTRFLDGARELLEAQSVLALLKALAGAGYVGLIQLSLFWNLLIEPPDSGRTMLFVRRIVALLKSVGLYEHLGRIPTLEAVAFGECVPSKDNIEKIKIKVAATQLEDVCQKLKAARAAGELTDELTDVCNAAVRAAEEVGLKSCLLYTSPSPRDS